MQQVGDTMQYLTSNLITSMGWRNTWVVIGVYSISVGFSCVLFVDEPPRSYDSESEISEHSSVDNSPIPNKLMI